jgi:hypothetical protein
MKRIALVVAVGSLLATPVVFAQTTSQALLPPSAATAETSRDAALYVPPSNVDLPSRKSRAQNVGIPQNVGTVTGSFEDGNASPVAGSFEGGKESPVAGSFEDPTTH